jgi:competence protein ComEC
MQRTLCAIAILFALGVCLQKFLAVPFILLYFLAFFVIALSFILTRNEKLSAILILASYFLLGSVFYSNSTALPVNDISKFSFVINKTVFLKGIISSEPKDKKLNAINKTNFIFEAKEIKLTNEWHKISGKILVNCFAKNNLSYGDFLVLEGRLFRPVNFNLGARFGYADYLKNQGIYFIFSVKKNNLLKVVGKNRANFFISVSFKAKKAIQEIIRKNLPSVESGILEAFILGERSRLPREINNLFVQTGTVHILAISGFNVGIVIFIVLILLKFLRISRSPRVILTILFIIIYAIITGSQPSVIRASIMAIVILIGILLQRESDIYNSVSFAAIIILMLNPKALFDVGFQLSFLSVISIVWLEPKIEKPILKLFNSKSKALILVVRSLSVSLAAWLGVAGLVLYYFSIFSPVTILANLFIVPFSSLIVALGFCLIILGGIFPAIAFIFSGSLKLCLDFLVYAVWLFHRLPASFFYLRPITIYQVLGYYLILFTISYLIRPPNAKVVE